MAEPLERISVSKDFLRAELLGMELRLVDKLATKDEVAALREEHGVLEDRVTELERRDGERVAIRDSSDQTFTRLEKRLFLALALCAGVLNFLVVTGVIH